MPTRPRKAAERSREGRGGVVMTRLVLAVLALGSAGAGPPEDLAAAAHGVFAQFDLPDAWEARFWGDPGTKALLALDVSAWAGLVPVQAGVRYCRCPACDATEADNTLAWSAAKPGVLTCRRCGVEVPNDSYPAKDDKEKEKKVPEEVVEVLPRVRHRYPYHAVDPAKQQYPDERLYLAAKRDYEARESLAKAALYAAVRYHEQPSSGRDLRLARLACVLILRFAQVYPAYATHFDQPGSPKVFQQADLPPPYRHGYRTGKWDWTASLDVPMNLVIAYALLRDDPALVEAGRRLGDAHPSRTIERDLFRASAEFVRLQPEEYSEMSLQAYRGLLAVGRLLNDPGLVHQALARLDGFAQRGFYHDGFWRQGDAAAHRRILGQLDGWIDRLLAGYSDPPGFVAADGGHRITLARGIAELPVLSLARVAAGATLSDPGTPEVQQAAWPPVAPVVAERRPAILGGAGLARLSIGAGARALDLELRGQDNLGSPHYQRQSIRLAVAGRPVLGDLDDLAPTSTGWDLATASHNTVVVDGLNQGETPARAALPAPGGDFGFYAADPDFQVATLDDPRAYPQSTRRYRQTLVASTGVRNNYAVGVFEVQGGLQHDQVFHAAPGLHGRWQVSVPLAEGPGSLLPATIPYVPAARAEDGRWFVQAYGELTPLGHGRLERPAMAWLAPAEAPGVRLHLLGDMPAIVLAVTSPDPTAPAEPGHREGHRRSGLIVRRRSGDGATLKSTFVTVFEPAGAVEPLGRVGRVPSPEGTVVVYIESGAGGEHVVVNLSPGTTRTVTLADGGKLTTDGRVVRLSGSGLVLAGGTFAEAAGRRVSQQASSGRIVAAVRRASAEGRGWFEADHALTDPAALAGRALLVRHGDGTTRAWTLRRVENTEDGARLHVVEEPGFAVDKTSGEARYYQFPRASVPGPHHFHIAKIARSGPRGD